MMGESSEVRRIASSNPKSDSKASNPPSLEERARFCLPLPPTLFGNAVGGRLKGPWLVLTVLVKFVQAAVDLHELSIWHLPAVTWTFGARQASLSDDGISRPQV